MKVIHNPLVYIIVVGIYLSLFSARCEAGLKIYYIRHGEGGHNVVKEWQKVPREQWPVWVGNQEMFTPEGKAQVADVPKKLSVWHFDFIAVSPAWRARHTILGWLQAQGRTAEIWPELEEFGGAFFPLLDASDLPPPNASLFGDSIIYLPAGESAFFTLREDGKNRFGKLPSGNDAQAASDARVILQRIIDRIVTKFGDTNKAILLAGHANNGSALLRMLVPAVFHEGGGAGGIKNTGVWMVERQPDGCFRLILFNDEPVAETVKEQKDCNAP
ncbi:fructose-2,6-bisphosphatase [Opitutaceae bacterium TAV1]|nr:fructose-2,6-bisphosphatase [Opitutaceae bacterium TAV1]